MNAGRRVVVLRAKAQCVLQIERRFLSGLELALSHMEEEEEILYSPHKHVLRNLRRVFRLVFARKARANSCEWPLLSS